MRWICVYSFTALEGAETVWKLSKIDFVVRFSAMIGDQQLILSFTCAFVCARLHAHGFVVQPYHVYTLSVCIQWHHLIFVLFVPMKIPEA